MTTSRGGYAIRRSARYTAWHYNQRQVIHGTACSPRSAGSSLECQGQLQPPSKRLARPACQHQAVCVRGDMLLPYIN